MLWSYVSGKQIGRSERLAKHAKKLAFPRWFALKQDLNKKTKDGSLKLLLFCLGKIGIVLSV